MVQAKMSPAAKKFIKMIETCVLPKAHLPNTSPNYSNGQEANDTKRYVEFFLKSSQNEFVKECRAGEYIGEE